MDNLVNLSNTFWDKFPQVLEMAVKSRWVSIAIQSTGHAPSGAPTFEERYEDFRNAATQTQIVEISFTFGVYDKDTGMYTLEIFEFATSPFLPSSEARLSKHLARTLSMSPTACDFLRRCEFPLESAIYDGVSYLNRQEELLLLKLHLEDPHAYDMLSHTDQETRQCRVSTIASRIHKCVGVRYLIDALTGHPFASKIDPAWCGGNISKTRLNEIEKSLKDRRPILVGHNVFDTLFLMHALFIGELPRTASKFSSAIHNLFPRIVDIDYVQKTWEPVGDSLSHLEAHYQNKMLPVTEKGIHPNTSVRQPAEFIIVSETSIFVEGALVPFQYDIETTARQWRRNVPWPSKG
ncbi:ribonuclease H-like domain-containing protein [Xylaria arbuscula]|nr:ribonuclease H-like domain-containing protein [Xylaria arbuscula]